MKKTIYFDNAATTHMDDRVLEAMMPYMKDSFGNANGKYSVGYEARKAVNEARKQAAAMLGA
ncbi:MAG: aminotransferase class V-fold PLP-dependent enzyme, partial [Lachnospiraceae bacterium]|nr:aminotransferase class V-fold PLP-dependent enzyme [Lachnospiraceae bacterium]